MNRNTLLHILEWIIALAACAYLIWRIATYDDYPALLAALRSMSWSHYLALALCIALMPLNMTIEAWRWRTLIPMTWRDAHRQVYYSKLAGLITPWRLGEYPARGLLMTQSPTSNLQSPTSNLQSPTSNLQSPISNRDLWSRILSMGAVGSATMTAAILFAGIVALAFSPSVLSYLGGSYLYALAAVTLILLILFALMPRILRRWAFINNSLLIRSTAQSLVRLACWCLQLYLVLFALNAIDLLPFTYLLPSRYPHSQRPDSRSRRPRRVGHFPLRFYQRCPRRSAPLGHKYPPSVSNLAFFA